MTFVDEGKLKLDRYGWQIPARAFKKWQGWYYHQRMPIAPNGPSRHRLLKEALQDMKDIHSMDQSIQNIAEMSIEGKPGTVFRYSNVGLQMAAAVIEKISGKNFETLFAERVAKPCGMTNTDFGKGEVAFPAGGAWSTPTDYVNFLVMILNKGTINGKRVLSEKSISDMQADRITPAVKIAYAPTEAGNAGYGFGEWVLKASGPQNPTPAVSSPGLFGSFPWVK
jgi:CubicO group peptidase (beta-lactamase class C family)